MKTQLHGIDARTLLAIAALSIGSVSLLMLAQPFQLSVSSLLLVVAGSAVGVAVAGGALEVRKLLAKHNSTRTVLLDRLDNEESKSLLFSYHDKDQEVAGKVTEFLKLMEFEVHQPSSSLFLWDDSIAEKPSRFVFLLSENSLRSNSLVHQLHDVLGSGKEVVSLNLQPLPTSNELIAKIVADLAGTKADLGKGEVAKYHVKHVDFTGDILSSFTELREILNVEKPSPIKTIEAKVES